MLFASYRMPSMLKDLKSPAIPSAAQLRFPGSAPSMPPPPPSMPPPIAASAPSMPATTMPVQPMSMQVHGGKRCTWMACLQTRTEERERYSQVFMGTRRITFSRASSLLGNSPFARSAGAHSGADPIPGWWLVGVKPDQSSSSLLNKMSPTATHGCHGANGWMDSSKTTQQSAQPKASAALWFLSGLK